MRIKGIHALVVIDKKGNLMGVLDEFDTYVCDGLAAETVPGSHATTSTTD